MSDSKPTYVSQWNDGTVLGFPEFWNPDDINVLLVEGVINEGDLIAIPLVTQHQNLTSRECAFQMGERTYQANTIFGNHFGQSHQRTIALGDTQHGGYDAFDIRSIQVPDADSIVRVSDIRAFKRNIPRPFCGKLIVHQGKNGVIGVYKPYKANSMRTLKSRIATPENNQISLNSSDATANVLRAYNDNITWMRNALSHCSEDMTALHLFNRQFT